MVNLRQAVRPIILASLLFMLSAASVLPAYGQQFDLLVSAFKPKTGVDPGGSATATIDLQPIGGFDGQVALSCAVTSNQFTTNLPQCLVSPGSAIPPANGPALTVTTTVTQTVYLSVVNLTEDYTLTVSPTIAIPSPLPAGSSATTTVSVLPIGSYSGQVTLACLTVSPIVTAAPYCTFNPATVNISSSTGATSTLTIQTFGAASTSQ